MKDMEDMDTSLPKLRDNILAAWQDGQSELDTEQVEALRKWRWERTFFHFRFLVFTFTFLMKVGEGWARRQHLDQLRPLGALAAWKKISRSAKQFWA